MSYRRRRPALQARYRRKAPYKARRYVRKTRKPPLAVKRYVDRAISRRVETKVSSPDNAHDWYFTSYNEDTNVSPSVLYLHQALSNITQGVGQGDRIGNRIRLKKFPCLFQFSTPQASGNDVAMNCRLIIGQMKKDIDPPTDAYFQNLIQKGSSSSPPTNRLESIHLPINKDLWTVKAEKRFMLQPPSATYPTTLPLSKNIYHVMRLDIAKYLPKYIEYNDTATAPGNCSLFAFMICSNAIDTYTAVMTVKCPVTSWVEFEDA